MDESEVADILRRSAAKVTITFSEHFHRRNELPERRFTPAEIRRALVDEPLIIGAGMGKWLAVNRVGERYITLVFILSTKEKVFLVTAYPSKGWERRGYIATRDA